MWSLSNLIQIKKYVLKVWVQTADSISNIASFIPSRSDPILIYVSIAGPAWHRQERQASISVHS